MQRRWNIPLFHRMNCHGVQGWLRHIAEANECYHRYGSVRPVLPEVKELMIVLAQDGIKHRSPRVRAAALAFLLSM